MKVWHLCRNKKQGRVHSSFVKGPPVPLRPHKPFWRRKLMLLLMGPEILQNHLGCFSHPSLNNGDKLPTSTGAGFLNHQRYEIKGRIVVYRFVVDTVVKFRRLLCSTYPSWDCWCVGIDHKSKVNALLELKNAASKILNHQPLDERSPNLFSPMNCRWRRGVSPFFFEGKSNGSLTSIKS